MYNKHNNNNYSASSNFHLWQTIYDTYIRAECARRSWFCTSARSGLKLSISLCTITWRSLLMPCRWIQQYCWHVFEFAALYCVLFYIVSGWKEGWDLSKAERPVHNWKREELELLWQSFFLFFHGQVYSISLTQLAISSVQKPALSIVTAVKMVLHPPWMIFYSVPLSSFNPADGQHPWEDEKSVQHRFKLIFSYFFIINWLVCC